MIPIINQNFDMLSKSKTVLSLLLQFSRLKFSFATSSEVQADIKLRILQQKAYLASKVIQKIISPDPNLMREKSLSDQIVDQLREQQRLGKVKSFSRQKVEQLFTTGIQIDQTIFAQQRVDYGLSTKTKLFKFFPSHLVTGQVFKKILESEKRNTLWVGHYGISKTISVMLFWHLSSIITEYNFKTYGHQKTLLKREMETLNFKVPKILYCSVTQQLSDRQYFRDIIVKQVQKQIQNNQLNYIIPLDRKNAKRKPKLKYIYLKKNIFLLCVIDQINILIAAIRQKLSQKEIITKQDIKTIRMEIEQLGRHCFGTIFMSSVNVQDLIYKQLKWGGQLNHMRLSQFKVQYCEKLGQTSSICQLIDVFIFQFGQTFKIPLFKDNWYEYQAEINSKQNVFKKRIRKTLINHLQKKKGEYLLTFLSIKWSFDKSVDFNSIDIVKIQQKLNSFSQQQEIEQIQNLMIQLLEKIISNTTRDLKLKFQRFFQKLKDQPNKYFLTWELYYSSKIENILHRNSKYKYRIDMPQIQIMQQLSAYFDKHLFKQQSDGIYCLIPPKLLNQIMKPYAKQSFIYIMKFYKSHFLDKLTKSGLGGHFELLFISILCLGSTSMTITTSKVGSEFLTINQGEYHFESIPKDNNSNIQTLKNSQQYKSFIDKIQQNMQIKNQLPSIQYYKKSLNKINKFPSQKLRNRIGKILLKRKNNWKFLQSIRTSLQQSAKNYEKSYISFGSLPINIQERILKGENLVFVPTKVKKICDKPQKNTIKKKNTLNSQNSSQSAEKEAFIQQDDQHSKCIDFMIANINHRHKTISINAFDATISNVQFMKKLTQFIQEFLCFEDRHVNEILLASKKYKIQLNYFAMGPNIQLKNLSHRLNKRFYGLLEFSAEDDDKNSMIVRTKNSETNQPLLLKSVGIIPIKDILIKYQGEKKQESIDLAMLQEVEKLALNKSREKDQTDDQEEDQQDEEQ